MLSVDEIKKLIKEKAISTIFLQFVDINGAIKSINMPSAKIDEILSDGIMFDGSSISGFRQNETMDLVFHPDLSTFMIFPDNFPSLKNTARFICDIYNADGTEFYGCPRCNLKKIINNAKKNYGYSMYIGPEVEFFLFKTDSNHQIKNIDKQKTGYYDLSINKDYDDMLVQMMVTLQDFGFDISAIHHEGAPFQYEVDLGHDDVLKTADNLITFKFITKTVANHFGYKASFMPKPVYGQNGSGIHLNISIENDKNENIFYNPNGQYQLSQEALYSIGSILKNIKGITAVLNPTVNSYKRLVKDYEAPIYLVWSVVTRSALVRIPQKRGKATRLELRSPDPSMNPYLSFATVLQTCVDGIRNKVEPPLPVEKNLFLFSSNEIKQRKIKSLPRNMFTSLEEFEKSLVSKAALGDFLFNEFLFSKRKEWNDYRKQVTPWELEKYMDI